ncbi:MAG: nucleotidyl transferase AbiEii/AbiGii toxin family protein [Actinomycetia bacterium]|nr:nucleotidyl transferase AbiEii/AbiGii toxin family protein [Actinomycetes bacterium]
MMLPVIEKELLHYEILRAMQEAGLLSNIVFQGGTCLRLCYGAPRYSEDLDFSGGADFKTSDLSNLRDCITQALPRKYAVTAEVRGPKERIALVQKWRIRIDTIPDRPDLPSQKIALEVAAIPSYTRQAQMLQLNYEGLPASYEDVMLFAESPEEILADKLVAFVCSQYIRHRDIWDMFWIMRRPHINLEQARDLQKQKVIDYGEQERFEHNLVRVTEQLPSIIESDDFRTQMKRFLPAETLQSTLERPEYRSVLQKDIRSLYSKLG